MCDGDKRKASECEHGNAIMSVRKRGQEQVHEGKNENEYVRASARTRVRSLNNVMPRARDKVRG